MLHPYGWVYKVEGIRLFRSLGARLGVQRCQVSRWGEVPVQQDSVGEVLACMDGDAVALYLSSLMSNSRLSQSVSLDLSLSVPLLPLTSYLLLSQYLTLIVLIILSQYSTYNTVHLLSLPSPNALPVVPPNNQLPAQPSQVPILLPTPSGLPIPTQTTLTTFPD